MAVVKLRETAAEIMLCQTNFIYDGITEKCRKRETLNKRENAKENNNNNNNNNENNEQTLQKIWWLKWESYTRRKKANNETLHNITMTVPRSNKQQINPSSHLPLP
jgi:hypothetical protein